jgi:hypothetical protein
MVIVAAALPTVIVAAVLAFAWPAGRIAPRDLPIGIVGATPGSQQLIDHLTATGPGNFAFHLYDDDAAARSAIWHRDIYGAFAVTAGRVEVLEATAASPAVAQLLDDLGTKLSGEATEQASAEGPSAVQLTTQDVVPLPASDPKGMVFSSALLPLTICSIIVAAAIGVAVRFRPAWRQIVALSVVSAVAGGGAYLISQAYLGALPDHGAADWASLTLTMLAISASTAGLIALIGVSGLGIAAALMVFIGNPFSGVTSAPQLLPTAVGHIGQWLPPGAGANLLRSTAYVHGNGAAGHVGVLVIWVALGFAAISLGHHAPIRFAAAGPLHRPAAAVHPPEYLLGLDAHRDAELTALTP